MSKSQARVPVWSGQQPGGASPGPATSSSDALTAVYTFYCFAPATGPRANANGDPKAP